MGGASASQLLLFCVPGYVYVAIPEYTSLVLDIHKVGRSTQLLWIHIRNNTYSCLLRPIYKNLTQPKRCWQLTIRPAQIWIGPIPSRIPIQKSETLTTSTCEGASFFDRVTCRTQPHRDSNRDREICRGKGAHRKTEIEHFWNPSYQYSTPNFTIEVCLKNFHAFQLIFKVG